MNEETETKEKNNRKKLKHKKTRDQRFFSLDNVYRHPKTIVGVILIITLFFALQLPRMQIDNNNFRFVPESDPARQFSEKLATTFGDEVMILIGVKREFSSIIDTGFIQELQKFTHTLEELPLILEIQSIVNTPYLGGEGDSLVSEALIAEDFMGTQKELSQLRTKLRDWDMYKRSLVSDDLRSTQIIIYLDVAEENAGSPEVGAVCRKIVSFADAWNYTDSDVYVTGLPVFNQMVNDATSHDLMFLVPVVVMVVIGVLCLSFRRMAGVILPLLTVLISTVWAIGAMPLFGIKLSILATVLPVILVAVGSAYGIHVVSHYFDFVDQTGTLSREKYNAQILWAVKRVIRPVFLAALTTFAGFVSFCFTPAVPISEFGIFASLGVIVAFVISVTFIPSVLILAGPRKQQEKSLHAEKPHAIDEFIVTTFMLIVKHKRVVMLVFFLLVVFSWKGVSHLVIDNVLMEYFQKDNRVVQSDRFIKENFGGSKLLTAVVSCDNEGDVLRPEVLGAMSDLSDYLQKGVPEVGKVSSLVDLLKRINQVLHANEVAVPLRLRSEAPAVRKNDSVSETVDADDGFSDFDELSDFSDFSDFDAIDDEKKTPSPSAKKDMLYKDFIAQDFIELMNEILTENNHETLTAAEVLIAMSEKLNRRGSRYYEIPTKPQKYGVESVEELKGIIDNYLILLSANIKGFIDNPSAPKQLKMNIQLRTDGQKDTDVVVDKINRFIAVRFPDYAHVELGGSVQIEKSLNLLVVRSQLISIGVSLCFVFLILSIFYRSAFAGIIGVIPLGVSILVNFGIMGITGIKLNIGTSMVASFSIGIGIDYTIHYLSAYHHACMDDKYGDALLSATFFDSGKAILFNAASVGAGFAVLMLSDFNMLGELGFLIAVSMGISSLSSLTLLPTILEIVKPRFIRKVLPVDISLKHEKAHHTEV